MFYFQGSKDLHWITTYDASNSGTISIQNHPCRILPGEFDSLVSISDFVQESQSMSCQPRTVMDSIVCQLFSIMSQYESLNPQKRMIGDFKQTLVARSSHDVILLVPFVPNSQPEPEREAFDLDFGLLSMTQAYNVQYYCLSILKALSRLGNGYYTMLQKRIKSGFASPNDLNILFSMDCFISGNDSQNVENFYRENWSKKNVFSMMDYLKVCFIQNYELSLVIEIIEKDLS